MALGHHFVLQLLHFLLANYAGRILWRDLKTVKLECMRNKHGYARQGLEGNKELRTTNSGQSLRELLLVLPSPSITFISHISSKLMCLLTSESAE
ncbi:hypothetical protein GN956_G7214 [Arapaima gigas]